ncbi:hypothetical protein WJM97_06425 [Okeanomitos corallinicola TIOX110]|uniref:Uncharacterized protein n=1 Tax=Okeanomitos corallinicola TIOX110 TaxID=3133117 RepID=A0ABZ2UVA2_9CYAN
MDHHLDLIGYWHDLIHHHEQVNLTDQHLNTDEIQRYSMGSDRPCEVLDDVWNHQFPASDSYRSF